MFSVENIAIKWALCDKLASLLEVVLEVAADFFEQGM